MIFRNGILFHSIPGYVGYYISLCGKVYSARSDSFLSVKLNNRGHLRATINGDTKAISKWLMMTFKPWTGEGEMPSVLHLDGDKLNNRLSNLQWTYAPQSTGPRTPRQSDRTFCFEVRRLFDLGYCVQQIALVLKCHETIIRRILGNPTVTA